MQSQSLKTPSKGANQPCSRKWALSSAKKALDSGKRVLYSATKNSASLQKSSICVLLHAVAIAEDSKHKVQKSPLPCESALFFAKKSLDSGKIALFSGPRFRQKSPFPACISSKELYIYNVACSRNCRGLILSTSCQQASFSFNKAVYFCKRTLYSTKEPCISKKKPHISAKERFISAKELFYVSTKEPYVERTPHTQVL